MSKLHTDFKALENKVYSISITVFVGICGGISYELDEKLPSFDK